MPELAVLFGMNLSPLYEMVVLFDFVRSGAFLDLELEGVLVPVPTSVKSETPSSSARRGVATTRAMLDLGESLCVLDEDLVKCVARFPP